MLTTWKTDPLYDPIETPKKPDDFMEEISLPTSALGQLTENREKTYLVKLEPQRIRSFKIEYIRGAGNDVASAEQLDAEEGSEFYLGAKRNISKK